MNSKIKLLIVDDHPVVRNGIAAWISSQSDLKLIGEAQDGIEAVEKAKKLEPDVILMDLVMPKKDGIEAIREIIQHDPNARILVITSFSEDKKAIDAIKAGAMGFIIKDTSPSEMLQAIRQVFEDKPWLSPDIIRMLIREKTLQKDEEKLIEPLSEREIEVLILIAQGLSDQDIANSLVISRTTVRFHVNNILSKLNLENRTQAALYAIKNKYIVI